MKNQNFSGKQSHVDANKRIKLATISCLGGIHDKLENIPQTQDEKQINKSKSHSYRPDIDGLRTIAILIVIIFHAFPSFMTGGFIGVDVFFVISGYLISQMIIKETLQDRFSYADFYSRRIKRIYPALLLVLAFVMYIVVKKYSSDDLVPTLKTLSASTVFGANLQILIDLKTYFDPKALLNPLLHLWSLGVEEQFYIFWPCLISIGLNFFRKRTFWVLTLYTVFSFAFGVVSVFISKKFAFYFPVCRFWQMAVGGLVAYQGVKIENKKITNALSVGGTFAILITVWFLDIRSLFPGFWALIPTLASACIIQAGTEPFINKHILSSQLFVFIGKISYPMYLWHAPLLVFSRYFYPEGNTSIGRNIYFILLMTVLLSILTYYFVENPIRQIKTKKIAIILLILVLALGALSCWFIIREQEKQELEWQSTDKDVIFARAERQMMPRPQDCTERNGKIHPNLSKSHNRRKPTVNTTQVTMIDYLNDLQTSIAGEMILEKHVTQESKYYVKDHPLHVFQVANEGKKKQFFFMGDSHSVRIGYRFQQLYRESLDQGKADLFPTVVGISKTGFPYIGGNTTLFHFTLQLIKKHMPKRLLLAFDWLLSYCSNGMYTNSPKCRFDQFHNDMVLLQQFIREVQQLGVEVSSTSIWLDHPNFDPIRMIDVNGIIEQNIKPVNQTWFVNNHKVFIEKYETALRDVNVSIIDLAENLCYQGICEVTSPSGYSVMFDSHHLVKFYSRHWLSVLDQLVQF